MMFAHVVIGIAVGLANAVWFGVQADSFLVALAAYTATGFAAMLATATVLIFRESRLTDDASRVNVTRR